MLSNLLQVLAVGLSAASLVSGAAFPAELIDDSPQLGINCRGSGKCSGDPGTMVHLREVLKGIDPNRTFKDGRQIACVNHSNDGGAICVFAQNLGQNTVNGGYTQGAIQKLIDHGCKVCGSVPLRDNDVAGGEVTVNWVSRSCLSKGDPAALC